MSASPSIPELFRSQVKVAPDAPLVVTPTMSHSFAAIDVASDRVAAALRREGIVHGDRIALYCINGAEFVIAYLGIVKAGAVVVPVNLLIGTDEITHVLTDSGVRVVIYHEAMQEKVAAVRLRIASRLCWVCVGTPSTVEDLCLADWLAVAGEVPVLDLDADADLAAILYTSGTTGQPKGAMLTHRNLVSNTNSVCAALDLQTGRDRLLVALPMFHSFAATVGVLTPCLHGLSLVPVVGFDPVMVGTTIAATGANVFLGVPSMYGVILRLPEPQRAHWAGVRFGVSGGAAMPVALLEQFEQIFGFPILEGDGPTECSPVTCVNPLYGIRKPASVGLPVPDVEMMILDGKGMPLDDGEIGEVCVRGPNVMKGYWKLPEATADTFFGAWLRTGDLGYRDGDGYFFLVDRSKDMIIVNGMNVYPRMVEEVLYQHPDVVEAAVVGESHVTHGEIVVAHVVVRPDAQVGAPTLRAWCRERLGQHQVPRKVILRQALPKNATGKILKRELRQQGEIERGIDSRVLE